MKALADLRCKYLAVALCLLISPRDLKACTQVFPAYNVGPKFSVKVLNCNLRVEGRQLRVLDISRNDAREIESEATEAQGIAQFKVTVPGKYFIEITDGHGDVAELDVRSDRSAPAALHLASP